MAVIEAQLAGAPAGVALGLWVCVSPLLGLFASLTLWASSFARGYIAQHGATIGAHLLGVAMLSQALKWGSRWALGRLNDPHLLPEVIVIITTALTLLLPPLYLLLSRGSRALLTSTVARMAFVGLGVTALSASLVGALLSLFKDPPTLGLSLLFCAITLTIFLTARGARAPLSARLILIGSLTSGAVSLAHLGKESTSRDLLIKAQGLSALIVPLAHQLSDQDQDGFGSWLGGGDCDDEDASRHPAAYDLPGNGVDEDCDGVDEPLAGAENQRLSPRLSPQATAMTSKPTGPTSALNLLIITIDALRADHVGWMNYHRDTTPNLKTLTRSGLVFTRAYTPCADTRYSIPPLMSGQPLPSLPLDWRGRYLVLDPRGEVTQGGEGSIFKRLRRQGYQTAALTGELMVDGMWYGLERDLDRLYGDPKVTLRGRSSARLTREARKQLRAWASSRGAAPWGLWLHYIDPHEPYLEHSKHRFGPKPIDRYDGEIASTDEQIGALLEELKRLGMSERTLIVLSADHGEEFEEHGRRFHGKQLYDESTRVPLVISVPGAPQVEVTEPISTLDMVETVAELMGLTAGLQRHERSHAGRLRGEPAPPLRPVITYRVHNTRPQLLGLSIIEWPYKLIYELSGRRGQLFHLVSDPGERSELSAQEPERFSTLLTRARREVKRFQSGLFESLYARQVRRPAQPPRGGEVVSSNLTLVERSAGLERLGGRALYSARASFYVHGQVEALRFKTRWRSASGEVSRTLPMEPLAGLYPTSAWREGELITVESFERLLEREAHSAELLIERPGSPTITLPISR